MNKNIKRIVALAAVIGTISSIAPAGNINFLTTKAYASNSNEYLDTVNLYDEDGDEIKLYENSDYTSKVDEDEVEAGEVYYARTSSDTINIDAKGVSDSYVRVFRGSDSTAKGKELEEDIKLDSDYSTTTFVIKVFGEDPGDNIRYKDCDDYDVLSTYRIKVKYDADATSNDTETSTDADDYDDIYLDRLSVDGATINLSKSKVLYTYDVSSDVEKVIIRATPQDDYDVSIDGDDVDEDDKYKLEVDLSKGENKIKIKLEDDDEERVYTLVINRGSTSNGTSESTTPSNTNNNSSTVKNSWVQVNGKWQYKDAAGSTVKNSWVQNYFVQADGNMATDWLNYGGKWYYLGVDGAKKTGWQLVNGKWYYLDTQGVMVTGWMKDMHTGKYYYLNSNGSMAFNTTVGGYKLGANGAWTGR